MSEDDRATIRTYVESIFDEGDVENLDVFVEQIIKEPHWIFYEGAGINYDPMSKVVDSKLEISDELMEYLRSFREKDKFKDSLVLTEDEKDYVNNLFNRLLDFLIPNLESNPSKTWVVKQFEVLFKAMKEIGETEVRNAIVLASSHLLKEIGVDSTHGVMAYYS